MSFTTPSYQHLYPSPPSTPQSHRPVPPPLMVTPPSQFSTPLSSPTLTPAHCLAPLHPLDFSPLTPPAPITPPSSQFRSSIFAMATSALHPRVYSRSDSMDCQAEAGPSNHRRSRSREFWSNLGFSGGGQKMQRKEDVQDDRMDLDEPTAPISVVLPPSLPTCTLAAAFQCSDTNADIPPAFYPGQAIPTILTFQLDRYSSLPHALNPTLTMSLVGTLHTPHSAPRTIICVSVSLAEGLALWARDATSAYADRVGREDVPDVSVGLPGGTYSLPLTVQVPSTPRLPPSYSVPGASFAVTYALTVTLTCDDCHRPGNRVVLAEAARPFEMMPDTMPTRAPRFTPQTFWVRMDNESAPGAMGVKGTTRRPNHRWTVSPELPTTAFSPTSNIPLKLGLKPPTEGTGQAYQVLIRLSLLRREHSSLVTNVPVDPATQMALVSETEVSVRWGWITCTDQDGDITLDNVDLPITLPGKSWRHGYSTHLNVGSAGGDANNTSISVSSTFHLCCTLAFLPISDISSPVLDRFLPQSALDILPPQGVFTAVEPGSPFSSLPMAYIKRTWPGTIKTLPLPVVIGSVSEPRGAMHTTRWSDLMLSGSGETETGRMIHGEGVSCEDGWIVPPPDYLEACGVVPYIYA